MNTVKKILLVVIVLFALLLGWWVIQDNLDLVTVRLFGFDVLTLPVGLVLLISLGIGCLLGILATTPPLMSARHRAKKLEKQFASSRPQLENKPTGK